jgi:hypothetical protein
MDKVLQRASLLWQSLCFKFTYTEYIHYFFPPVVKEPAILCLHSKLVLDQPKISLGSSVTFSHSSFCDGNKDPFLCSNFPSSIFLPQVRKKLVIIRIKKILQG